jgi:prevent-host-death family protein
VQIYLYEMKTTLKRNMTISEVRNQLPNVVDEIAASRVAVVVTRHGKPVVSIVPFNAHKTKTARYPLRGLTVKVSSEFDEPMPDLWNVVNE